MIKIIKRTIGFFIRFVISMVVIALLTVILEEMGIYKVDTEDEKSIIVGLIFVIAGYWSVQKWKNEGKISSDSQLSAKQIKEDESAASVKKEKIEVEKSEIEKAEKEKEESNKNNLSWQQEIYKKMKNLSLKEAIDFKNNQLVEGNPTDEQRSFLNSIVSGKKEDQKIKKEEEATKKEKETKKQNKEFFKENNIIILPNGNLRDSDFEEYELEEERMDFIVYKPEGMKGKRAYIKTDGGNYLAWSGPIKIKDKSRFLRGDFEKSEEEVKPKEETTVLEQEDEISEPPEEKTEINDATGDISAKLEKLTKQYEEGILTKEEYQQKTNELISKI